jgi:hypothetical protein
MLFDGRDQEVIEVRMYNSPVGSLLGCLQGTPKGSLKVNRIWHGSLPYGVQWVDRIYRGFYQYR